MTSNLLSLTPSRSNLGVVYFQHIANVHHTAVLNRCYSQQGLVAMPLVLRRAKGQKGLLVGGTFLGIFLAFSWQILAQSWQILGSKPSKLGMAETSKFATTTALCSSQLIVSQRQTISYTVLSTAYSS